MHPEPQGAIAAFQFNNRTRAQRGLPVLEEMEVPCIAVVGTRPSFLVVPVSEGLSDAAEGLEDSWQRQDSRICIRVVGRGLGYDMGIIQFCSR